MKRDDIKQILELIPEGSNVLDLGCGDGTLLGQLIDKKNIKGYGIDIQNENIISCIKRGISAYQGNLNECLEDISDNSFDYVILSQTLQQIQEPYHVISHVLRIGKKALVSFPNFAHWSIRLNLLTGNIPKSSALPYEWYNTPNIRVMSIKSFRTFCNLKNIDILEEKFIYEPASIQNWPIKPSPNLFSEKGIFIIQKGEFLTPTND
jgi:methionine biosynthesis protein MetW